MNRMPMTFAIVRPLLLGVLVAFWIGLMTIQGVAQPDRNPTPDATPDTAQDQKLPAGFEWQPLDLGGKVLKPKHWKFTKNCTGKSLIYKMWNPKSEGAPAALTGLTINIVTNVADSDQSPSDFAVSFIEKLKRQGDIIEVYSPQKANGMIQSGVLMNQTIKVAGAKVKCRVRYVLIADDEREILYVLNFGAPVDEWKTYEPIFRTMTTGMKLFVPSKPGDPGK